MKQRILKTMLGLFCLVGIAACTTNTPSQKSQDPSKPNSQESMVSEESRQSADTSVESKESEESKQSAESKESKQSADASVESKESKESKNTDPSQDDSASGQGGASNSQQIPDDFKYNDYLLRHDEGKSTKYIFEAECTNLGGKEGPGYSGSASEEALASNTTECSFVTYLYADGMSLNFFVVSDRDVADAELNLCLGAEFMKVELSPETYTVRVDYMLEDFEDLLVSVDDDGVLGYFDMFLELFSTEETGGYIIESWDCQSVTIDQQGVSEAGKFSEFAITKTLSLKRGVNVISLITSNDINPNCGTMAAIAPVVDYISIKTTAQLGMFDMQDNGQGTNGCHIAGK